MKGTENSYLFICHRFLKITGDRISQLAFQERRRQWVYEYHRKRIKRWGEC